MNPYNLGTKLFNFQDKQSLKIKHSQPQKFQYFEFSKTRFSAQKLEKAFEQFLK